MEIPVKVRRNAYEGLLLRNAYNRGGTRVGVARAWQLVRGDNLSDKTLRRMYSFFSRHFKNRIGIARDGGPSAGHIAWLLWGGDAGYNWVKRRLGK